MPTYILLSTLSPHGVGTLKANPQRLLEVNAEVEQMGAKVVQQWAVLGPYDCVTILEAADNETVSSISIECRTMTSMRRPDVGVMCGLGTNG